MLTLVWVVLECLLEHYFYAGHAAYNLQVVHVTSLSVLEVTISLDGLRIDRSIVYM